MKKFVEFREAKEYVRSLGIKNEKEYQELRKSGKIPHSLPSAPNQTYKGKGWKGLGDFLGTGNIAPFNKQFLPFEEAREYVRSLGIKGVEEYNELHKSGKIPHSLPSHPDVTYKGKGWKGWGDFLGTGNISTINKEFLPFKEAREYVRSLGIKSQREYKELRKSGKIPHSLPSNPHITYKGKGWKGFGDFLGTGRTRYNSKPFPFLPFGEAREYVRSLGIKGKEEYKELHKSGKIPDSLPSNPNQTYKGKGWKGFGDFLGTGNVANFNKEFLPFKEAKEYVRSLGIKNEKEYKELRKSGKIPHSLPSNPNLTYKGKGWKGWGDFLGNGNIANFNKEFLSFEEAREFVRSLGIKGVEEYRELHKSGKIPHSLPSHPDVTYKGKGWKGYGDFLGNIKDSYTLTKEEVKVVKDMNKVDSTLSKIKSIFNRLGLSKEK